MISMPKRIMILMSDTGGGHRASAEAIEEALKLVYGDQVSVELVDVFVEYTPFPFNRFPDIYPLLISRVVWFWKLLYRFTDGKIRSRVISTVLYPRVRRAVHQMLREHPADVIVSVHLLFGLPLIRALGQTRPPVVTVVTDLVTVHSLWFYPGMDFTVVPTAEAEERGLACGIHATRIKTLGLPVSQKFTRLAVPAEALREKLGWEQDVVTVLLVGGGEGMGPLGEIARGLAATGLPIQLAVVCGRNKGLYEQLAAYDWPVAAHVYGFVRNMPELMRAADVVVSKAGPSSVMETLNSGRALVLSGAIPGQEEGNVRYVVDGGAGLWAPGPEQVVAAVRSLLEGGPERLAQMKAAAERLACPDAAREIALVVGRFLDGVRPVDS